MLHCTFINSINGQYAKLATTSELLFKKHIENYKHGNMYRILTVKHLTEAELKDYAKDLEFKHLWDVDGVLKSAYSDIYCYVFVKNSDNGNPTLIYELSNYHDLVYSPYNSYMTGSHNNMENLIRDLDKKFATYSKMGLNINTFTNIYKVEVENLAKKHNIIIVKEQRRL